MVPRSVQFLLLAVAWGAGGCTRPALDGGEGAAPSQWAAPRSTSAPRALLAGGTTPGSSPGTSGGTAIPGKLVVKFKSSGPQRLTQCAQTWISQARSFATATGDASASLDVLVRRHQVQAAIPLIRDRAGLSTAVALSKLSARFAAPTGRGARGLLGTQPVGVANVVNVYRFDVPPAADLAAMAADFSRDPHVEYAHPDYEATTVYVPNDPFLASSGSWGQAERDLWAIDTLGAEQAWDVARGAGVVVAVVDTGLDFTHPDIAGNFWTNPGEIPGNGIDDDGNGFVDDVHGWDFNGDDNDPTDGNGHGTHVSGTIAAQDNNGLGIVGVAPDAQIMPVKGLADSGNGSTFNLAAGLLYASANGADVINNSWGCPGGCPPIPELEDAVAMAYQRGSTVVFAAGNDNKDVRNYSPTSRPETIVVSASDPSNQRASFSNFGFVDVGAPGAGLADEPGVTESLRGILSLKAANCIICSSELIVGDIYLREAGTSMAAPHVAGLAALILSQHPDYSAEQVRQVIRRSATDASTPGFDLDFGYGIIHAGRAVAEPVPLAARIFSPLVVGTQSALVVNGTAAGPAFQSFVLEFGQSDLPSSFTTIASSRTPVQSGALGTWNVGVIPDGEYTLRLTAITTDGREYEDRRPVTLDRVRISSPEPLAEFGNVGINIVGTAAAVGLDHFVVRVQTLSDGTPLANANITLTGNGQTPVDNGLLAVWNPAGVPADEYRIVLEVTLTNGTVSTVSVPVAVDTRIHPGWPIVLDNGGAVGVPLKEHAVLADLNRDGRAENIVAYAYKLNVFEHDGTQLAGWPQIGNPDGDPTAVFLSAPAIGNIDSDPAPEVVASTQAGTIWAWNANGTVKPGWPIRTGSFGSRDVTLADVDGDGTLDVVLSDFSTGIDVRRGDGSELPGFPIPIGVGVGGGATVADLNKDGRKEIIAVASGAGPCTLFGFDNHGAPLPGFPQVVSDASSQGAYAVVGDIDDDGILDIVVSCAGFSDINGGVVAAYHANGQPVAGWPKAVPAFQMSPAVLGDLDGDGSLEVLTGVSEAPAGRGALYVWDGAGNMKPGWPVFTPSSILFTVEPFFAPIVLNADADPRAEVIVPRLQDVFLPELLIPYGHPIQGFEHDGTSIPSLARPMFGNLPFGGMDMSPGVADLDGDGRLELVFFEDRTISTGDMLAHVWDLDVPANTKLSWPMFRADPRHSAIAEPVVPIVTLTSRDRNDKRVINGLGRFYVTTGQQGIIQIVTPWQAPVQYAVGSDLLQSLPFGWGGPVQLQPFTRYLLRVVTPTATTLRIDWW
jgi:subtilisin family serine protease